MSRSPKPGAHRILSFGLFLLFVLVGCPKPKPNPDPAVDAAAPLPVVKKEAGDPGHGKELVLSYQCNRCHDGTGHEAAPQNKHCVHCHKDIMEDRFKAPAASIARWKPRVKELADAPSLEAMGKRFTRAWVREYLLQPSDLRPHLQQYMPRLAISTKDADDIAAYLVPDADPPAASEIAGADLGKGRALLDTKGCGSCHVFTGVAAVAASPPPAMDPKEYERAHKLAPDLRVVRERMTAAKLTLWLTDSKAVKPDSAMPKIALTPAEVKDLAGYLMTAEITAPPAKPKVARLPVLTRKITFKEVDEKVFHRTCWHCHSEPDYAIGDGGPGNSGGFGFKPRGLNLSDYNGITAGFVDDKGERQSVFAKDDQGVPRMVRALLARHEEEEQNVATGTVRGMPLGYDALSLEDIQLVDTWIAQGRPR
jgi:mono/diheme cytochrome c family protein